MESSEINDIFSSIHGRYDIMNHLFSLWIDTLWRRSAAEAALSGGPRILDIATGTGDLAIEISTLARKTGKKVKIRGVDFNRSMLAIGIKKAKEMDIAFDIGNAHHLPYKSSSFDVAVSGFALRNLEPLDLAMSETYRILSPGGIFVFVDMALPDGRLSRDFFNAYLGLMEFAGSYVNDKAYSWLAHSIRSFDVSRASRLAKKAGFNGVKVRRLATGIAYMMTGRK